jgi:hypothetical protein
MNQRLTDLRRAQLDQLLAEDTHMAGGGLLKAVAKAAKPAVKAVTKVAEAAPQAEALRLAQQRAKSVGQSKDPRTRMLQQGYDDSWYHGTTGDISRFRPDLLGETTGAQSAKKGFFFARDPLNPPESMLKKSNDPAAGDLLRKMGIPEEDIAKLNTVSMEGHGPDTASGYALIGGSREYKEAMRKAKAAERRGDWPEYEKQMQIAEDSETTRMQYGQGVIAKYGDARDEMLEDIKNAWYGPQNSERFKNMSQADYEAYDKKFKELMPYGWYNSYSNSQLEGLKKELFDTVGEKNAEKVLNKINKFQSARNERALIEKTQEGGNVMPVALRYENPMVYDFEGKPYRDQSYSDLVDQALTAGNDALILKNTYDPGGGPSKLIDVGVVFEPDQIRSRFAAFDPLRKTAATAAAAGLAAPDLLAKEQDKAQGGLVHLAGGGDPKKAGSDYTFMGDPSQFAESGESKLYPKTERMNRGVKAIKSGLDSFNRLIDSGPSVRDVLGNVVGAVPFVGPDLRKGMEDSTLTIPYEFQRSATNPKVATGVNTAKVPTTDILDALKMSDITGGTGASSLLGSVGKGYAPNPMDVLDTLGLGVAGYGAAKVAGKGAMKVARAGERFAGKAVPKIMERGGIGAEMLGALGQNTQSRAVKQKGGNWVDTEVQRGLKKFKQDESYPQSAIESAKEDLVEVKKDAETWSDLGEQNIMLNTVAQLQRDIDHMEQTNAFNKWVDTKAGSYIRNQMATPDDPVLKMLDARTAKIEADYQAGQQRLAKLDERIAQAPTSTTEEQNTLANLKRTRAQRAAEIESDRELAMDSMLPGGKDNAGYDYLKNNAADLINTREEAGFPIAGYGQSDAAKAWEAAQDSGIGIRPAEKYQGQTEKLAAARGAEKAYNNYMKIELPDKFREFINKSGLPESDKQTLIQNTPSYHMKEMMGGEEKYDEVMNNLQQARSKANAGDFAMAEENPYLAKLPPETPVYNAFGLGDLGIDHILDVLKDDIASGKMKLEDLNKITMDQAVKRAAEYDFEMAKKARDAVAQSRATMPVYKEYPEGYKWVQLTKPGEFNAESNAMGHSVRGYEPEKGHPDWTPESGDSGREYYGHGGWEGIKSGKAKVYSLIDPSGKPHSTIEVKANPNPYPVSGEAFAMLPSKTKAEYGQYVREWRQRNPDIEELTDEHTTQALKEAGVPPQPDIITQIKGKGNARPSEKYDPYTQDFVKSGKWADVSRNDLRNTGLIEHSGKYFTEPEFVEAAKNYGRMGVQNTTWEVARQRHIDAGVPEEEALLNWVEAFKDGRGTLDIPDEPNMAGGGLIGKLSKAAKTANKIMPTARIGLEAPGIIIPSKVSNVKEAVRQSKGDFGARRVERAADEIPNLEQMYREEALRQAFTGDNAKGLMTINPSDFERYATPLMPREKPWPGTGPKKENLPTDEYVNYLAGIDEYHDVPFLEINKQEYGLPLVPFISGHEGRHRNRAMAKRGEKAGLVQLLPRSELREPFPRRSQEEYLQALRDELEMTGNVVVPQPNIFTPSASERPAIELPDVYAKGGSVGLRNALNNLLRTDKPEAHMAGGGITNVAKVAKAAAAKAAKAPAVIPNLLRRSTASEIGRDERALRQAAAQAEEARALAASQTPMPIGYVKHTELSPNPHVGHRYEAKQLPGIAKPTPIDIGRLEREKKGASLGVMPWDSQSRNVEVSSISGEPLTIDLKTHGGQPYALDEKHLEELIGGSSGKDVAEAIQERDRHAIRENREKGGTGEVLHAVTTMGKFGENYSNPPSEFAFELINRRLQEGRLTQQDLDYLNNLVKTHQDKTSQREKGIFPYANFAGFETPEGMEQIYTGGYGLKTSPGNLRKAIAANLHKVEQQKLLGFNSEDLINATTEPSLRGVDKGYIGGTLLSNDIGSAGLYGPRQNQFGIELAPASGFPYNSPYSTDFSARYYGQLPDMIPLDVLMHRQLAPIEQGLLARKNKKPYTEKSLRNAAIGSLEKSNEGVSQVMDSRFFQDLNDYMEALNKPLEKKKGGLAQTKKVKRHGNTVPH